MLMCAYSDDASHSLGRTWSNLSIVHDEYWQGAKAIGNPAPVWDATTNTVHLVYMRDGLWVFAMYVSLTIE